MTLENKIVGLTGNICSGKSTVAGILEQLGANVLKTDAFLYEAYTDSLCKTALIAALGKEILTAAGDIDRLALKKVLVKDPAQTKSVWSITDLYIQHRVEESLSSYTGTLLILEAAQLYEQKWDQLCVATIFCYAPNELRVSWLSRRAKERDGLSLTEEQARHALTVQSPQKEKIKCADFVIYNDRDMGHLIAQTQMLYEKIRCL